MLVLWFFFSSLLLLFDHLSSQCFRFRKTGAPLSPCAAPPPAKRNEPNSCMHRLKRGEGIARMPWLKVQNPSQNEDGLKDKIEVLVSWRNLSENQLLCTIQCNKTGPLQDDRDQTCRTFPLQTANAIQSPCGSNSLELVPGEGTSFDMRFDPHSETKVKQYEFWIILDLVPLCCDYVFDVGSALKLVTFSLGKLQNPKVSHINLSDSTATGSCAVALDSPASCHHTLQL